jgi:ATP-dependent DNA helicase RecG
MAIRPSPRKEAATLGLDSPVSALPRCTTAEVKRLEKLELRTVSDLLFNLPFGWEDFGRGVVVSELRPGERATVVGTIASIAAKRTPRQRKQLTEARLIDDDGDVMKLVWFNQPYIARMLREGERIRVAGVVRDSRWGPGIEMQNPQHERVGNDGRPGRVGGLTPKYHLTAGLSPKKIASWVDIALGLADQLEDVVPESMRRHHHLLPVAQAVRLGHKPGTKEDWPEAGRRMQFAELLEFQAAFWLARRRMAIERATPVPYRQEVIDRFKIGLGFELTLAQRRAIWEVYQDMEREVPMNRLLDGDVGSGKTAVAAAAAAMAHAAGLQTVVMAPTEILARQHLAKFRTYLEGTFEDLKVELLVSDLGAAERRRVRTAAASGHCAVLVGTHALIKEGVELSALGLAVVDEQHRFGTRERELLRAKSPKAKPHFLCMSATPIPRTLALAIYGEMALSTLDELPPGRTPIATKVVTPDRRQEAYDLVRREVKAGRQAFVICPLVEESDSVEARAATVEFERLNREVFPDLRMSLVHGRMKDKDSVMRRFHGHEIDVLVATAVIEVGVDVPNATVMLIEGADRFGLAQLHQFRGRVGRGSQQSYCMLLADEPAPRSLERLRLLSEVTNGFQLAKEDMRLRGAGELMGKRQHGMSDRAMAALQSPELLSEVGQEVGDLAADDPGLERWPPLRAAAERRLAEMAIS